jgi:hypothetical protein
VERDQISDATDAKVKVSEILDLARPAPSMLWKDSVTTDENTYIRVNNTLGWTNK